MRVRGLGYWVGTGLGVLALIGMILWMSAGSASPGQETHTASENLTEPAGAAFGNRYDRAAPDLQRIHFVLKRLRSRAVDVSDGDHYASRRQRNTRADYRRRQSQWRKLRVNTDDAETGTSRSGNTSTVPTIDDEAANTTTGPPAGEAAAGPGQDSAGQGHGDDGSTQDTSHGTSEPKPEADNEDKSTSTTAGSDQVSSTTTTADSTTQTTPPETTTTKAPTTTATQPSTTVAPTTTKAPTTTAASGGGGGSSMEQRVIELTNDARRQAGCQALVHNDQLRKAAYLHSKDMSDNDYFSHTGRDGSSPGDRISRQGYQFRGWAENIAWGYRTPEAVVEGWMNSSGHRSNILNCSFTEIGVGFHNNYWTQNFGVPR